MKAFYIEANQYLKRRVKAFYHTDYLKHKNPGNPDYLNVLKNDLRKRSSAELQAAVKELDEIMNLDFQQIQSNVDKELTVCVVPRAKKENYFTPNQQLFRATVQRAAQCTGFIDGTNYIIRNTNTKTTHLAKTNIPNDGDMPSPGILKKTLHSRRISETRTSSWLMISIQKLKTLMRMPFKRCLIMVLTQ
jgi:acetylglutamate synthase